MKAFLVLFLFVALGTATIRTGKYQIMSVKYENSVLEAVGTGIKLTKADQRNLNQTWTITDMGNSNHLISCNTTHHGLVYLEAADNLELNLRPASNSQNQVWKILVNKGFYRISKYWATGVKKSLQASQLYSFEINLVSDGRNIGQQWKFVPYQ